MKVLFLTPRLPLPADTGAKTRTLNLLKGVAARNDVTLLSFYFEENDKGVDYLKGLGLDIRLINMKEPFKPYSIFSRRPYAVDKYRSGLMADKIRSLLNTEKFNLIHFDHLHMGQYLDYTNGLPSVLDEHNVESILLDRCAPREHNSIKRLLFKSQSRKMADIERRLVKRASRCLTVSESDRDALSDLSGRSSGIEVVPNGVDTDYFNTQYPILNTQYKDAVVFTGSMDWLPNIDAVKYFSREILPLIWKEKADMKFYIVGRNPAKELNMLTTNDDRIIITGTVDDVRPFIAKSKVFVAPLRIGGGTRLKILEAMSMERAVVSTSLGAEGIKYTDGMNILIADDPRDFAGHLLSLLEDGNRAREIGMQARKLVCERYDWNIITKRLDEVYKEAVSAKYQ